MDQPITDTLYGPLHPAKQPQRAPKPVRGHVRKIRDCITHETLQALRSIEEDV